MSATAAKTANTALKPLILAPGLLFWVFIGYGIATENETALGVGALLLVAAIVAVLIVRGMASAAEARDLARIWSDGDQARATIIRIKETGASFNDHPQVDFQLEVTDRTGRRFETEATTYVRTIAIPRIQPGCELDVRIDPENRGRIALDEDVVYPGYDS